MLLLGATASALIDIITGSAGDIEVDYSYIDVNEATPPVVQDLESDALASITTAATTTIVTGATSTKRRVKQIHVYNNDASVSNLVTLRHNDSAQTVVLCEVTLLPGELLLWDGSRWIHYDVNLGQYPQVGAIATQAEMEAGTSLVTTVSPGRQHFHPSAAKFWAQVTGGAAQALGVSYNVTSITDGGVGLCTVTIATDFSSAAWVCQVSVFTSATGGDEGIANISSKAAGSVQVTDRIITPALADPNVGYDVIGYGDQA